MIIDGIKFSCEPCLRGHRSANCPEAHGDRPLFEVKKKGRPKTQCVACQRHRLETGTHIKCICAGDERAPAKVLPQGAGKLLADPSHSPLHRPSLASATSTCSSASSTENLLGDQNTVGRKKSVSGSRRKDSNAASKPHNLAHGHDATMSHIPHAFSPYPQASGSHGHGHPRSNSLTRTPSSASSSALSRKPSPLVEAGSTPPRTPSSQDGATSADPPSSNMAFLLPPAHADLIDTKDKTQETSPPQLPMYDAIAAADDATVPSQAEVEQILASLDSSFWQSTGTPPEPVSEAPATTGINTNAWQLPLSVDELQNWQSNPTTTASSEYGHTSSHGGADVEQVSSSAWPSSASSSVGNAGAASAQYVDERPVWPALDLVPTFDTEAQIDRWRQVTEFETRELDAPEGVIDPVSLDLPAEWMAQASSSEATSASAPSSAPASVVDAAASSHFSLKMDDRCETITPVHFEPADPHAFDFGPYGRFDEDFISSSGASSNFSSSAASSKAASSVDPSEDYSSSFPTEFDYDVEGNLSQSNLELALSEFQLSSTSFDHDFAARSASLAAEIAARQAEIEALSEEGEDDEEDEDSEDRDDDEDEKDDENAEDVDDDDDDAEDDRGGLDASLEFTQPPLLQPTHQPQLHLGEAEEEAETWDTPSHTPHQT